jgi:hypothetical protein
LNVAGDCRYALVSDEVLFLCAGRRRQRDRSIHARESFWFGQRHRDDCFGQCKMLCELFGAVCCGKAANMHLIDCVVVAMCCEDVYVIVRRRLRSVCDAMVCRFIPVRCRAAGRYRAGDGTTMAK